MSPLLFAVLLLTAQDAPPADLGDWAVFPSKDGQGCFATRRYAVPGNTTLLIGIDGDGSNHLSLLNDRWSIRPGARLSLAFKLTKGGYPDQRAIGIASNGQQGFVAAFEPQFPSYFASSKALFVDRDAVPVARLPLDGSGAAIAALRRCVDGQRAAAQPKADYPDQDGVPADPFAAKPKRKTRK